MKCNSKTNCGPRRCDPANAKRQRQESVKVLADLRAVFILRARRMLLLDLLANGTATADDVWAVMTPFPAGIAPRCLIAVPGALARQGIIRSVDRVQSVRPERRGARVALWVLVDREKALRWLRDNRDLPDPGDNGGTAAFKRRSTRPAPQHVGNTNQEKG